MIIIRYVIRNWNALNDKWPNHAVNTGPVQEKFKISNNIRGVRINHIISKPEI